MSTLAPAFLADSYNSRAFVSRRSVQQRRSQPHNMRSAKTMSRDAGRRFQKAAPAAANALDRATAERAETAINRTPPRGAIIATSNAGRAITRAVANIANGRDRQAGMTHLKLPLLR